MEAATTEAAYDRFAADYRDWWAPVIAPAAVSLLDRLDGQVAADRPTTLVDIGTGTGTLALAALRRWPQARVIGVDPARRLLEMAEAGAREAGIGDRLTTRVGEAGELPLADASVDGAMTSFVLQLTPNRAAAVREAFRVLRPGGVFAHLTWRADEDPFEPDFVFDDALDALRIDPPDRPDRRRPRVHLARERGCRAPPCRVPVGSSPNRVAGASVHAAVLPRPARALDRGRHVRQLWTSRCGSAFAPRSCAASGGCLKPTWNGGDR